MPTPGTTVICNPTHVTCHATPEQNTPLVPGQKYTANLDHLIFSTDGQGRSYLEFHVNVEN